MWNFTSPSSFLLASGYRARGDVEPCGQNLYSDSKLKQFESHTFWDGNHSSNGQGLNGHRKLYKFHQSLLLLWSVVHHHSWWILHKICIFNLIYYLIYFFLQAIRNQKTVTDPMKKYMEFHTLSIVSLRLNFLCPPSSFKKAQLLIWEL